jgi:hypothetical protein
MAVVSLLIGGVLADKESSLYFAASIISRGEEVRPV